MFLSVHFLLFFVLFVFLVCFVTEKVCVCLELCVCVCSCIICTCMRVYTTVIHSDGMAC